MNYVAKFVMILAAIMTFSMSSASAASKLTLTTLGGDKIKLSVEQLAEMPATEFETTTPWTTGVQKFRGVSFAQLFDAYGITSETVRVAALNDYSVIVPTADLRNDGAILAYHLNGSEMSVREKGPFWVVFPYDSDPRFQTDAYWAYSVWQVKAIDAQD
ncbi:molybdopterin-dependent oxidoreductase [Thalassospira sp. MA62]|nr:molybdopterin-dependent oxidoreductase [Thalassospira sp. MA62]